MESMNLTALTRLVGINENTLRGWERRYEAVTPGRDENGRRVYSLKEVERIKVLWALVKEGHTIGRIASLPTPALKKMLRSSLSPEMVEISATSLQTENFLTDIINALEKFNLEKLNQSLQKARFELSSKEIVINLIGPLLVKVGHMISEKVLSITQEHILSSLLRDYLGNLNQSLSPYDFSSRTHSKKVILTTREGDVHEFGIMLSGILCNLYRYQTFYLGPNMPLNDLIEASLHFKSDYIVLGLMTLPKQREIISAQDYVNELDRRLPRKVTFCVGGSNAGEISKIKTERQIIILSDLDQLDKFLNSHTNF